MPAVRREGPIKTLYGSRGRVSKARKFADRFKPQDTGLFDMFGGDVDDADREDRALRGGGGECHP